MNESLCERFERELNTRFQSLYWQAPSHKQLAMNYPAVSDLAYRAIDWLLVLAVFSESKKRRIDDDAKYLISDAARSVVHNYGDDQSYFQNSEYIAENLAKKVGRIKPIIVRWLSDYRDELAIDSAHVQKIGSWQVTEHPMKTFARWLDKIEHMKGTPDYMNNFDGKRFATSLVRVGNAVLTRDEWNDKVERLKE